MPDTDTSVRQSLKVMTILAQTLEDVERAFLRIMDENDRQTNIRDFERQVKNGKVTCLYLESIQAKRLKATLDKNGVPYLAFDAKTGSKDMIFVPDEYAPLALQYEKNLRIYAGLEIDEKRELDKAIYETESPAARKEYVIRGLNEYEANRITQMAAKSYPKFVAVSEKQPDDTYIVASHGSRAKQLNVFAMTAMLESNNPNPIMERVKENQSFWNMQKASFKSTVDDMRAGRAEEAYLFSTKEPGKYMHIYQYGYEIVKNGTVTNRDNMTGNVRGSEISLNPENYADRAWLFGNSIEDYVYVKASEVDSYENGAPQFVREALPNYPKRMHPNMVKGEREFINLTNEFIDGKGGMFWRDQENYRIDAKMLMNDYRTEINESTALSEDDKQKALKNIPYFEAALNGFLEQIQSGETTAGIEDVKVSGDEIISVAKMRAGIKDVPLEEPIYDKAQVDDIRKGKHIDDGETHEEAPESDVRSGRGAKNRDEIDISIIR